jgi:hypothetical protein
MASRDLFTMRFDQVTRDVVEDFLRAFESSRSAVESSTVEFKLDNGNAGVAKAISGMANARGGLVFVGIDEKSPTTLVGTSVKAQDTIVNQCRALLDPVHVPEDIAVVPADGPGEVVLVIRVEPQPHLAPMFFKNGVYVRVPGNTMPATRDQVLAMATSPAGNPRPPVGSLAQTLLFGYRPDEPLGDDSAALPDLKLRVAGAFMVRPAKRICLVDDDVRQKVMDALERSLLHVWTSTPNCSSTSGWRTISGAASRWSAAWEAPRRHPPGVVVVLTIISTLERLTWVVDVDVAQPPDSGRSDSNPYVMQARDMFRGLMEMISFAGSEVSALLSEDLPYPPLSPTELAVWVVPRSRDLVRSIALDRHATSEVGSTVTVALRDLSSTDMEDVPAVLGDWFAEVFLDAGLMDAASTARDLVRQATEVDLVRQPWF